jgi:hypothetical protein
VGEDVRPTVPIPCTDTSTADRNRRKCVGRTLSENEETEVFIKGRVRVPWEGNRPRGDSTQGSLQHKSKNGWFDEGLKERLGHSTNERKLDKAWGAQLGEST